MYYVLWAPQLFAYINNTLQGYVQLSFLWTIKFETPLNAVKKNAACIIIAHRNEEVVKIKSLF